MSKADRTKQFIIEKTALVFNTKGYAGTSINDLMNVTGLSKGSIYGNFENKDEVALAAFDYNYEQVTAYLSNKMAKCKNTIERLLIYPNVFRHFLSIPVWQAGCPILNTSTEADDTHPLLRKKAVRALSHWKNSIENQIEIGINNKEIKPKTNPKEIAIIIISIIEGAVMQAKVCGKATELKIAMNYLEKLILGLKT